MAITTSASRIIEHAGEFYVYSGDKLVRVVPSIGMAREVASAL